MLFRPNNISFTIVLAIFLVGCASSTRGYSGYGSSKINNSANMHRATMRSYVVNGKRYYPTRVGIGDHFSGMASWYGDDFHGKRTSNGEIYNMYALTAAHKILPMNTMVKVTNLLNNRSLIVRINDRGPFVKSRIIDLSYKAASRLGIAGRGTAPVRLEVVGFSGKIQRDKTRRYERRDIGGFLVQIGAFRNLDGAKVYAKRLVQQYGTRYNGVIKRSLWNGYSIYRVYMRGFRSEEEATDFIKLGSFDGAFIVRDI